MQDDSFLLTNARICRPGTEIFHGNVLVKEGRITEYSRAADQTTTSTANVIDAGNKLVTPGLIDMHTHGIERVVYDGSPENLQTGADAVPKYGTTMVFPTLIPTDTEDYRTHLADLVSALDGAASPFSPIGGFHLEGPFVAETGAGCQPAVPDLEKLQTYIDICGSHLKIMSISPELPNIIPVIEKLRENQILPMITHTRAGVEDTEAAIAAGATHATHFYDVFFPPEETDPGARPVGCVEAFLAEPQTTVDFIADGIHVHPTAIKAVLAAKGIENIALITDSNIGAGLPAGVYETPFGFSVRASPDEAARIADQSHPMEGVLAGSSLTMNRGIKNLLRWLGLPDESVWSTGTTTPARLLNLPRKGHIEPGMDADLVLWRDDLTPEKTWLKGTLAYDASA